MRVRTSVGALATVGVLASGLAVVLQGDGHFLGNGLTPRGGGHLDDFVFTGLRGGLTYLVLFFLFHLGLRKAKIGGTVAGRWAYALIGAAAAGPMNLAYIPLNVWQKLAAAGALSLALSIVTFSGWAIGFIYHWRAGLDPEEEPSETIEAARNSQSDPALIATAREEYFDGPLQVRTSILIMALAALAGSLLCAAGQYVVGAGVVTINTQLGNGALDLQRALADTTQATMGYVLLLAIVAPLPFAFLGLLGHVVLRGLKQTAPVAYGAAGVLIPALLTVPFSMGGDWGVGVSTSVGLGIVMSLYRSMAGLEPVPVKEDIILNDRRNLVGADHARRKFGRLIKA